MVRKSVKVGRGIVDAIKHPIDTVTEALRSVPSKLNNRSTETLKNYGLDAITKVEAFRTPLDKGVANAISAISLGEFDRLKEKHGFSVMYHAGVVFTLVGGIKVIAEKNEVVNITLFSDSPVSKNSQTEFMNIAPVRAPNLITVIANTKAAMGDTKFYDYEGLAANNCQAFAASILFSNNMYSNAAAKFIMQDVSGIKKELDSGDFSYVAPLMNGITNLGSRVSRLIGTGKKLKKVVLPPFKEVHMKRISKGAEKLYDLMKKNKFRFL